ncbi:MAG: 13E12 repeat family protein [Acidimicrobiales bacterium]
MLGQAREHVAALVRIFGALDPDGLSGEEAGEYLELGSAVERLGTGVKVLVAPRAAEQAPWRDDGHRSEASWVADVTKASVPEAAVMLRAGRALSGLPATAGAAARGELTLPQLRAITDAAAVDPAAEPALLESAAFLTVRGLQKCARDVVESSTAPAAPVVPDRPAAVGGDPRRHLRFWTDGDGLARISGAFMPDAGAELFTLVRSRAAHAVDEARRAGLDAEPQAAYDADALLALVVGDDRRATFDGPQGGRTRSSAVVFHLSMAALERGRPLPGERCDVEGLGPISVAAIEHVLAEAALSFVVEGQDGACPHALPPLLSEATIAGLARREVRCSVPGCRVTLSLEAVVVRPPASRASPSPDDIARLCAAHHRQFTYGGFRLQGGSGRWRWIPPP